MNGHLISRDSIRLSATVNYFFPKGSYLHVYDIPSLCDVINTFSINFDFSQPGIRIDMYVFIPFDAIYIVVFFSHQVKIHIALTHSLPLSLAHKLFILFIHGILIVSCLTLVKKVSKSLYQILIQNRRK